MTPQPSRIYFAPNLNRLADEYIEIPFRQIQERSLSDEDRAALPLLIDDYGRAYLRDRYTMSIAVPLCSRLQAAAWATQFGPLKTWVNHEGRHCAYVEGHPFVWAHTREDSCLLAGIQVLRDHSIACLNPAKNEKNN